MPHDRLIYRTVCYEKFGHRREWCARTPHELWPGDDNGPSASWLQRAFSNWFNLQASPPECKKRQIALPSISHLEVSAVIFLSVVAELVFFSAAFETFLLLGTAKFSNTCVLSRQELSGLSTEIGAMSTSLKWGMDEDVDWAEARKRLSCKHS